MLVRSSCVAGSCYRSAAGRDVADQPAQILDHLSPHSRPSAADDALLRTKLIKMHSRRPKDTPVALRLYDEMRADGVVHDAVCYNTCLTAAGKAGPLVA